MLTGQGAARPSTFSPLSLTARKRRLAATSSAVLQFWEGVLCHRNYAASQSEPKTMKKTCYVSIFDELFIENVRLMMG